MLLHGADGNPALPLLAAIRRVGFRRPSRDVSVAARDMERSGIDIVTDGEIRRESYSNRFATALSGIDLDNPATVRGRTSGTVVVPRIVGPIRRMRPVEVRDVDFLRHNTDRLIK